MGTESLDKYASRSVNHEDCIIEVVRDKHIYFKVTCQGKVICETNNWQKFHSECVDRVLNLSRSWEHIWKILCRRIVESPHIEIKLSDILSDMKSMKKHEGNDASKLEEAIDKAIKREPR